MVSKMTKWNIGEQTDELRQILLDLREWNKKARKGGDRATNELYNKVGWHRDEHSEYIDASKITDKLTSLEEDDRNKRVWGFPLHTSFKDLKSLW